MPMPEGISKGPIFMRLDTLMSSPGRNGVIPAPPGQAAPPSFLADLQTDPSLRGTPNNGYELTSLAKKYGLAVTAQEIAHLENDWFRDWWPHLQAEGKFYSGVDEVIRKGLIRAIEVANKLCLPVDCYWLCHMQHEHETMHSPEGEEIYKDRELDPFNWLGMLEEICSQLAPPVLQESMGVGVCWSPQQVTVLIHTPPPPPGDTGPFPLPEPIEIVTRATTGKEKGTVITKPVNTHT